MKRKSTYEKFPTVAVTGFESAAFEGPDSVVAALSEAAATRKAIVVETYPGTVDEPIVALLRRAFPQHEIVFTSDALKPSREIEQMTEPDVTDDPVFGRLTRLVLADFFDAQKLAAHRTHIEQSQKPTLVFGVGASLFASPDLLIYCDLARWEIQMRQRRNEVANLGVDNRTAGTWPKYKRAFFVDWRVADEHKRAVWSKIDFFLDTNIPPSPKLVSADAVRAGLKQCTARPFRVVPFFDPGVWGGQWMKEVCDLDRAAVNYAWCFDCVPEENSLLVSFGNTTVELPSINLVHQHPRELLGEAVFGRFGAEFPIRFDFLDTIGGGNLSLQVHPLTEYIQHHFGMTYTQDESYYMLDAEPDACVYLGLKTGAVPSDFVAALNDAQADAKKPLVAEKFVNKIPAAKHDHFLIPAGTVHCSGRGSMVLEISATPYIFTFKLWDWGRLDLNGKPRPISIKHGAKNIVADRDTVWTHANLVNRFEQTVSGDGWVEQRTGLHETEFIETRRHWFTGTVPHDTRGTVNVLNLVEGEEATVESPTNAFAPFVVHYAETFIVPAAVGAYTIRPSGPRVGQRCGTMKAFVRSHA